MTTGPHPPETMPGAAPAGPTETGRTAQKETSPVQLTRFQKHVLLILRAIGPASYEDIRKHCRQPAGVKKAVYRLRCVGLAKRTGEGKFDTVK